MNALPRLGLACLLASSLMSCSDNEMPKQTEEQSTAAGKVLPGSVSDDMLPLDTVKSQAPPAMKAKPDGDSDDKDAAKQDAD